MSKQANNHRANRQVAKDAKAWWNSLDGKTKAYYRKVRNLSSDVAIQRYYLANHSHVSSC